MPSKVANGTVASRFELPALNLNFGNITDGTDIPPPPDSPIEKKKPSLPEATIKKDEASGKDITKTVVKPAGLAPASANGNLLAGTKRPADDIPPSPTMSIGRPGSLRRLLSRTLLNNSYAEGQQSVNGGGSRPASRSGASFMDDRKSKRASGWFKRLRGADSATRRASLQIDSQQPMTPTTPTTPRRPAGPPPPMIPELADFKEEEGGLGNDLFKNIK